MIESKVADVAAMRARDIVLLWGPVLACMAAIYYVSSLNTWTTIDGPPLYRALRKSGHIFEYAALALLIGRALERTWTSRGEALTRALLARVWWVGVTLATLYALTDEFHQSFVPRRGSHLADVAIDALSATAALGIWYIVRIRQRSRGIKAQERN
jgi:VanZ family protein